MKRLSIVSEVVCLLRELGEGTEVTSPMMAEKMPSFGGNQVSAALCTLEDRGVLEWLRVSPMEKGRGVNVYKVLPEVHKYPLRNAPSSSTRDRKPGYKVEPKHKLPVVESAPVVASTVTEDGKTKRVAVKDVEPFADLDPVLLTKLFAEAAEKALDLATHLEALSQSVAGLAAAMPKPKQGES